MAKNYTNVNKNKNMRNSNQEYQKKYMPEADVVPGRKVR